MSERPTNEMAIEFAALLTAVEQKKTLRVPVGSRNEATRYRFVFYNWRKSMPDCPMKTVAEGVIVSIEGGENGPLNPSPVNLVFRPKSLYSERFSSELGKLFSKGKIEDEPTN